MTMVMDVPRDHIVTLAPEPPLRLARLLESASAAVLRKLRRLAGALREQNRSTTFRTGLNREIESAFLRDFPRIAEIVELLGHLRPSMRKRRSPCLLQFHDDVGGHDGYPQLPGTRRRPRAIRPQKRPYPRLCCCD